MIKQIESRLVAHTAGAGLSQRFPLFLREQAWLRRPQYVCGLAGVKELRDSGMGASAIAKEMGIGRASIYRALQG